MKETDFIYTPDGLTMKETDFIYTPVSLTKGNGRSYI